MDIEKLYKIKESVILLKEELKKQKRIINDYKDSWNDIEKLKLRIDELGKIVQTITGTGSPYDPYKTWVPGTEVKEGDWWITENGFLWEVIKNGIPSSETDNEYFDVINI